MNIYFFLLTKVKKILKVPYWAKVKKYVKIAKVKIAKNVEKLFMRFKMGLYSKFNVNLRINNTDYTDCRAFYLQENGSYQRVGADELNNCENCLTENDVMNERVKIGIPFASLKTEAGMVTVFGG